jgi:hypothetical protein
LTVAGYRARRTGDDAGHRPTAMIDNRVAAPNGCVPPTATGEAELAPSS